MSKVSSEVDLIAFEGAAPKPDIEEGMSRARGCFLDELPGAAFGIITLGYLVMSLLSLAW